MKSIALPVTAFAFAAAVAFYVLSASTASAAYETKIDCRHKNQGDTAACIERVLNQTYVADQKPKAHVLYRETTCKAFVLKQDDGSFTLVKTRAGSVVPRMGAPLFTTNPRAFDEKGKDAAWVETFRSKVRMSTLEVNLTAPEAAEAFLANCK